MWVLVCLFSGLAMVAFICRLIWQAGWRRGHQDAWDDITEEFQRYE